MVSTSKSEWGTQWPSIWEKIKGIKVWITNCCFFISIFLMNTLTSLNDTWGAGRVQLNLVGIPWTRVQKAYPWLWRQNLVVFVGLFCDKPSLSPVYNCKISCWSANICALIHGGVCKCHRFWGDNSFPSNRDLEDTIAFRQDPKVQPTHFPPDLPRRRTAGTWKSSNNGKEHHLNQSSILVFKTFFCLWGVVVACHKKHPKQSNSQLYITGSRFKSEAAEIRKDQRKVLQVPKAWQVGVHVELGIRVFRYSENKKMKTLRLVCCSIHHPLANLESLTLLTFLCK